VRPAWLRAATLTIVLSAHAALLAVVLWPRSALAPVETSIEINITPSRLSAEPASPAAAAAPAEAKSVDDKPVEAKAVDASPADMSSPSVPVTAVAPSEAAPVVPSPAPAAPVAPSPVAPSQAAKLVEIAPAPPRPATPPPPAIPVAQSPTLPMATRAELPLPSPPATLPPPAKAIMGQAERQVAAEKRREMLLRQKQEAERQAEQRAAEKAKQAAETAKRQAEQREAQRAAKQASLPPANSPAFGPGQLRSPAAGSASPAAIGAYRGEVLRHLAGFKRYPEGARARGAQGRPSIAFTLDASGRLASVSLTHSSGQPDIDAEAVAMVRRASPFPAPPSSASGSFTATIGFVLH